MSVGECTGAMENYGCIVYRERSLLVDDRGTSAAAKQATARTVCHEIAHQWFGTSLRSNPSALCVGGDISSPGGWRA